MISRTGIHAVKALQLLAGLPPGSFAGAQEIAARIGAPPNYLGKLLRTLALAGVLESQKGKGGGFRLARPADEIPLFTVIDPLDHLGRWTGCFLGHATCSDDTPCAVHEAWSAVREAYIRFLRETSIADLGGQPAPGEGRTATSKGVPQMTDQRSSAPSPTAVLTAEHQAILAGLNALESLVAGPGAKKRLDDTAARELIRFFRGFADRFHHAKEEACLFPVIEQRGVPCEQGPIGVMLREHEEGRACVRAMDEAVGPAAEGDPDALARFVAAAQRFIPLLRDHIEKEDHCLFAMAEQVLTDEDRVRLAAAFRDADDRQADEEEQRQVLALARRLSERYAAAQPPVQDAPCRPAVCGH